VIRIPTGDFVGLIADVVPFACTDPELAELHCVRLAWTGRELHAQAHDRAHVGWSRWSADEDHLHTDDARTSSGEWELAAALLAARSAVVVSGYPSALYDELYAGWHRHEIATWTGQGNKNDPRIEVLWSNRPLQAQLELFAEAVRS